MESVRHAARRESGDAGLGLDAITARADAATPGPWHRRKVARFDDDGRHVDASNACIAATFTYNGDVEDTSEQAERDAEFIAHARADVPALVAEVERLRAALASQRSEERVVRESFAVLGCDCIVVFDREADDTRPTIQFCDHHRRSGESPHG